MISSFFNIFLTNTANTIINYSGGTGDCTQQIVNTDVSHIHIMMTYCLFTQHHPSSQYTKLDDIYPAQHVHNICGNYYRNIIAINMLFESK